MMVSMSVNIMAYWLNMVKVLWLVLLQKFQFSFSPDKNAMITIIFIL